MAEHFQSRLNPSLTDSIAEKLQLKTPNIKKIQNEKGLLLPLYMFGKQQKIQEI